MSRNYTLNERELPKIQEAIKKDKRPGVHQRAQVIHRLHLGESVKQIAKSLLVTCKTIYNWHDCWKTGDIDGLSDKAKSGWPSKATPAYRQLLSKLMKQKTSHYDMNLPFGQMGGCVSIWQTRLASSWVNGPLPTCWKQRAMCIVALNMIWAIYKTHNLSNKLKAIWMNSKKGKIRWIRTHLYGRNGHPTWPSTPRMLNEAWSSETSSTPQNICVSHSLIWWL